MLGVLLFGFGGIRLYIRCITYRDKENIEVDEEVLFDLEDALDRVDGDKELLQELIGMFFDSYESEISKIEEAISSKNYPEVNSLSHSIKSALGNLGAKAAFNLAYKLELMGKNEDLADAEDTLEKLKEAIEGFKREAESKL
ncbi:MAG: Hpt domain-containing protein [Candidatus Dadabacteria bacterium]|nr:MAG: Hpt domain-containing protein [Candidatus Dadabacteria bacterium]